MSYMENWKIFPCKNCLLKSNCSAPCFRFPKEYEIAKHRSDNNLALDTCLGCGKKQTWDYAMDIFTCHNCLTPGG